MTGSASSGLTRILQRGQELGFLGPGDIQRHVGHAGGFVVALAATTGLVVDLGSGGGIPALVVAEARPDLRVVLVESRQRRGDFLAAAVESLGWADRVRVRAERAELTGHSELRAAAGAVTARGFGPPAVVAECAAPLLRVGGILVVSEPPEARPRWPVAPLDQLGLAPLRVVARPGRFQVLEQRRLCPAEYPREPGRPAKRPLFPAG